MAPFRIKVMFVCMGNICRSPLAEGVFRHRAAERGVADYFEVASSGTGNWHVGQAPDRRMRSTAVAKGVSLDGQRAQQFHPDDLAYYDHVLTMDKDNLHDVLYLDDTGAYGSKVQLFRAFDPAPGDYQVPDPYYGGAHGFEQVFQIVDRTVVALLDQLLDENGLRPED